MFINNPSPRTCRLHSYVVYRRSVVPFHLRCFRKLLRSALPSVSGMGIYDFNRFSLNTLCLNSKLLYVTPFVVRPHLTTRHTCTTERGLIQTRNFSNSSKYLSASRKRHATSLHRNDDQGRFGPDVTMGRGLTLRSGTRNKDDGGGDDDGVRINKCFKSFASRRESDELVSRGRVVINDRVARLGDRVHPGDVVRLNGEVVEWERLTLNIKTENFVYVKHWKAAGVVCTTNENDPDNILNQIDMSAVFEKAQYTKEWRQGADRIFPVGRLDQMSTGIILLTSDGRVPNAVLGAKSQSDKKYVVLPDMRLDDSEIEQLKKGVVITTTTSRDRGVRKPVAQRTLRCDVERGRGLELVMTLNEGRNRQIRKMLGALGYTARAIHRISFMGITLDGLSEPGETCLLNEDEMNIMNMKLERVNDSNSCSDSDL